MNVSSAAPGATAAILGVLAGPIRGGLGKDGGDAAALAVAGSTLGSRVDDGGSSMTPPGDLTAAIDDELGRTAAIDDELGRTAAIDELGRTAAIDDELGRTAGIFVESMRVGGSLSGSSARE